MKSRGVLGIVGALAVAASVATAATARADDGGEFDRPWRPCGPRRLVRLGGKYPF